MSQSQELLAQAFPFLKNIKYLDPTLILWRSSSQWIGGLYFLFFLVLIFSNKQFNYKMNELTYSENGNINSETNIKDILIKIFICYSALSFIIFLLLNISEVRMFNSLNLSMSLISAGGFIPTNSLDKIINSNLKKTNTYIFFVNLNVKFFLDFKYF